MGIIRIITLIITAITDIAIVIAIRTITIIITTAIVLILILYISTGKAEAIKIPIPVLKHAVRVQLILIKNIRMVINPLPGHQQLTAQTGQRPGLLQIQMFRALQPSRLLILM